MRKEDAHQIGNGRQMEKYFEMLMEASPDCIKLFGLDNKLEYLSPGGLREHGFKSLDEAIGFNWLELIVPEQREEVLEKLKESVEKKAPVSLDVRHPKEMADREWCHLIINPVFDEKGDVEYFVGISRDISSRMHHQRITEERLDENERMNSIMVGRELKMVELKEENARLKKRIEELTMGAGKSK